MCLPNQKGLIGLLNCSFFLISLLGLPRLASSDFWNCALALRCWGVCAYSERELCPFFSANPPGYSFLRLILPSAVRIWGGGGGGERSGIGGKDRESGEG